MKEIADNTLKQNTEPNEPPQIGADSSASPPPQPSDLRLNNAKTQVKQAQPVSFGQGVVNWFSGVLNHIGKNPVSFVMSLGASIVVRGAISANLLWAFGIAGGLPALAVAVGASMLTSLVIGTVKNAFSSEKRSAKELLLNAAGAGLLSGVIGGTIGGYIDFEPPELPNADIESWPDAPVTNPYTQQLAWEINRIDALGFDFVGDGTDSSLFIPEYEEISYGAEVNFKELLESEHDWFMMMNGATDPHPYQAIHRDALVELMDGAEARAATHGIENPPNLKLLNHNATYAHTDYISVEAPAEGCETYNLEYDFALTSKTLVGEKIVIQSILDHEFGHVYARQINPLGELFQTPFESEDYADLFARQSDGNYEGLTRTFIRHIIEVEASGEAFHDPDHPLALNRIVAGMEQAVADGTFDAQDRAGFEAALSDLQLDLEAANLDDKIDLHELWEKANTPAQSVSLHPVAAVSAVEMSTAFENASTPPPQSWASRILSAREKIQAQSPLQL